MFYYRNEVVYSVELLLILQNAQMVVILLQEFNFIMNLEKKIKMKINCYYSNPIIFIIMANYLKNIYIVNHLNSDYRLITMYQMPMMIKSI